MVIYDLQKGSLLKRASAFILDGILLVILAVGFAFAASAIFHYNTYSDMYSASSTRPIMMPCLTPRGQITMRPSMQ